MLWNACGNSLYLMAIWIVTVLVTNISGFEDAGILSIAMSIAATMQTVAMFGVRNFQASDADDEYSDSTYFNFRNITCALSLVICIIFSLFSAYSAKQFVAILLFMIFRISESYTDVLSGIAQKRGRLDLAGKFFALKGVLVLVFFFGGYLAFKSLNAGLGFMALSSCLSTVFCDYRVTRKLSDFSLTDSLRSCMNLAKRTIPLCSYTFLFTALTNIPKIILEALTDGVVLGAYASVFTPATLIQAATGYIYIPFSTIFAFSIKNNDYQRVKSITMKIILAMLGITAFTLVAFHFFGEYLFNFIFGEDILEYIYLLNPIVIATVLLSFLGFLCMVEVVVRDFVGIITGCAAGVVAATVLSFVLIKRFSAQGTSYAIIIAVSLAIIISAISLTRKIRFMKKQYELGLKET